MAKIEPMENENAKTKKPLTRFGEFELLKAIAIMGLPAVHLMEEAMEGGFASNGLTKFGTGIVGLCAFGPSVFMMCMGFGMGGTRVMKPQAARKNGIMFLQIGVILNIFRWLIPGIIQALVIKTPLINDVNFCLQSDIYYFVGIFYLYYAVMLKLKIKTPGLVMFSVLTLTLNTALTPYTSKYITNDIVASLLGNIVYVDETSCFPLLSWAIFPSVGILLGEVLKKSDEEQRENIMRRMFDFSAVLFLSFTVFLYTYKISIMKALVSPANEYITDLPNVILLLSLALFLIALTYYLCKHIGSSKFMAYMLKISTYIVPFYLLQWVIIAWIFYALTIFRAPEGCYGLGIYFVCVVVVTTVCAIISTKHGMKLMKLVLRITNLKKKRKKTKA